MINATFPYENRTNRRQISANFSRIFQQLSKSLANYAEYFTFANETRIVATTLDLNDFLQQLGWVASKDVHRAGLLWGALDANFSAVRPQKSAEIDVMSQKFFFGLASAKLGKDWDRSFVQRVRKELFNYEEIAGNLSVIAKNIENRCEWQWSQAINSLHLIVDSAINALFPAEIPQNFTNIYELLAETRELYCDVDIFSGLVDKARRNTNLSAFLEEKVAGSMQRDNSSAGFLWEKFNEIVLAAKNQSQNATEDRYARELLKGLLQFVGNRSVPASFLRKVDASVFDYKEIVESFSKLAINSYNFSQNHSDAERFVEGVAVLSTNLRKVLLVANVSQKSEEVVKILRKCFEEFNNHEKLLRKIKRLFENDVDIRYFFGKAYEKARYTSKFEEAGGLWGRAIEIIEKGTNKSQETAGIFLIFSLNLTKIAIDEDSARFLAGFLRNFSDRREILHKASEKFNVSATLRALSQFRRELSENSFEKQCFFEIAQQIYAVLNELFPLVGYGYRYGLELRAISQENREMFEFLNATAGFFANFEEISRVFLREKCREIAGETLKNIEKEPGFFEKGWKFAKLSGFLLKEAEKSEERRGFLQFTEKI